MAPDIGIFGQPPEEIQVEDNTEAENDQGKYSGLRLFIHTC